MTAISGDQEECFAPQADSSDKRMGRQLRCSTVADLRLSLPLDTGLSKAANYGCPSRAPKNETGI